MLAKSINRKIVTIAQFIFKCRFICRNRRGCFNFLLSSKRVGTICLKDLLFILGTCLFAPVIGGCIADVRMGRYNAIFGSALLYIVGTIALTLATYHYPTHYAMSIPSKEGFLAVSLILIAIGTGGIKANVSPMGADQVEHKGPEMVQKFFDWFYWFIQIGGILAYTVVVYIQQKFSFFYGYLITAISMTLATILLLLGRNHYIVPPPKGSYMVDTIKIIAGGVKKKLCGDKSLVQNHWLDGAKVTKGGKFPDSRVEGVKCVIRLMPIFLTFIFYWTLYGQVGHTNETENFLRNA